MVSEEEPAEGAALETSKAEEATKVAEVYSAMYVLSHK